MEKLHTSGVVAIGIFSVLRSIATTSIIKIRIDKQILPQISKSQKEAYLNDEDNLGKCVARLPLILQNIDTNITKFINVRVINLGQKVANRRDEGITFLTVLRTGKIDLKGEDTTYKNDKMKMSWNTLIRGTSGSLELRKVVSDVAVDAVQLSTLS